MRIARRRNDRSWIKRVLVVHSDARTGAPQGSPVVSSRDGRSETPSTARPNGNWFAVVYVPALAIVGALGGLLLGAITLDWLSVPETTDSA